MATVIGVTAEKAEAIEAELITGASRQGTSLVFTKANGTVIQIPNAFPRVVDSYPVGSIYMSVSADNPSTYMGGGTWQRWGKGRVPVGLDEAQAEFDSVEETGGAKTVALTLAEMPAHDHGGLTGTLPPPSNRYFRSNPTFVGLATGGATATIFGNPAEYEAETMSNPHNHTIPSSGSGQAHNNLQPYITCYMWKRTA